MAKVKREFDSLANEPSETSTSGSSDERRETTASGSARKRQRNSAAALNFSIESIMKLAPPAPAAATTSGARHSNHHSQQQQQLFEAHQNFINAAAAAAAAAVHSPAYTASVSGDSSPKSLAGSSRASTPISPGGHNQRDELDNSSELASAGRASDNDNDNDDDEDAEQEDVDDDEPISPAPVVHSSHSHSQSQSHHNQSRKNHYNHNHHQQQHHNHSHSQQQQQQHSQKNMATSSHGGNAGNSSGDSRLSQVECQLDNKDMWDKFHSLNTEMIITKTGRRMFPVMKVQFHNLDPSARYAVSMDIVPVDNKRYRYAYHKSCWQVAGKADPSAEPRLYPHPDSPFNGDLLSRQVISFEKVKLTNNEMDKSGHIILNSMHKYQPRVHLIELKVAQTPHTTPQQTTSNKSSSFSSSSSSSTSTDLHSHNHHNHHNNNNNHHHNTHHQQQQQQQAPQLDIKGYRTFVFPETVFTAVTAYQNQLITKMKIDKNPFAKGFRDSSRLSDLDRNDPFDYMGSLGPSGRFVGGPGAPPGSMEAVAAAAAAAGGAHMDAYQLLASAAANNPWYSAAAVAAAAGQAGNNPFNPMGACSTAQAAQLQATQMWLAAFSACLNSGAPPGSVQAPTGAPGGPNGMPPLGPLGPGGSMLPMSAGPSPHLHHPDHLGLATGGRGGENGPDSSGGSSSSSANV